MAIFKNFPSVRKLVGSGILDEKEANLAYKLNRSNLTVYEMVALVEEVGLTSVARCMNAWVENFFTPPTDRHAFMELLNQMADGMCGIEWLGHHRNGYTMLYLNAGDSYCDTLIFHTHSEGTVRIGCEGDARRQTVGDVDF